ncbi:hypothetical protein N8000_05320 [Rhodospirillales bacterium]|nr:hypothetical protein [Rhodospirillales bacterium]
MTNELIKSLAIAEREQARQLDPAERAKNKLIANLRHQLKAAEAMVAGETYMVPRNVTVDEDGVRMRKQVNKPLRKWYWRDTTGQVRFSVRVANRAIEIDKGKTDIVVGDDANLPVVLQTVLNAAEAGELDKQVAAAVTAAKRK